MAFGSDTGGSGGPGWWGSQAKETTRRLESRFDGHDVVFIERGYGFIEVLDESGMFFHMSTVEGLQWGEQLTGRRVEFETIMAPNGRLRALRVRATKLGQRMQYDSPLPSVVESERAWCPSPQQIRAGCLEIQSGWTDDERRRRSGGLDCGGGRLMTPQCRLYGVAEPVAG